MHARRGADAEQEIDDLVRPVARYNPVRAHAVPRAQGGGKLRIARLRVAEGQAGALGNDAAHHGRDAERVFVAGHFDHAIQVVFFPDFVNGQARRVRFKRPHFGADGDIGHVCLAAVESLQKNQGVGSEAPDIPSVIHFMHPPREMHETTSHQYRYSSDLNGPSTGTPMYSACLGVSLLSLAPRRPRCRRATSSSSFFGRV